MWGIVDDEGCREMKATEAERLEAGAVLTRAEHELYQGRGRAPASTMFDGKPVPAGRNAQGR